MARFSVLMLWSGQVETMPRGDEDRDGAGWHRAIGWGLATVALLTVVVLVSGWALTIRTLHQAIEAREALDERYGPQEEFTPTADGAVPAERMEAFLTVRERLSEPCARITESSAAIRYVEQFEWVKEPPRREVVGSLWERARSAIGLEPRRGELWRARNEALLDAEMGLGEYTYIYVIAYSQHLVFRREEGGSLVVENIGLLLRIRRLLTETLRRQLAIVETDASSDEDDAWAAELAAEIARLEADPRRIPWAEGLPARIDASIAPYRERLDQLFCEAALSLELIRNERQGLGIHGH